MSEMHLHVILLNTFYETRRTYKSLQYHIILCHVSFNITDLKSHKQIAMQAVNKSPTAGRRVHIDKCSSARSADSGCLSSFSTATRDSDRSSNTAFDGQVFTGCTCYPSPNEQRARIGGITAGRLRNITALTEHESVNTDSTLAAAVKQATLPWRPMTSLVVVVVVPSCTASRQCAADKTSRGRQQVDGTVAVRDQRRLHAESL